MIKQLKEHNKILLEFIDELYENCLIDDQIEDIKQTSQDHADDMHLVHLLILKDRYLDIKKESEAFK